MTTVSIDVERFCHRRKGTDSEPVVVQRWTVLDEWLADWREGGGRANKANSIGAEVKARAEGRDRRSKAAGGAK
jgi:hypothetical protein